MTGSTGLIGSALTDHFRKEGHKVTRMARPVSLQKTGESVVVWDAAASVVDLSSLEGVDAVIHLAGANIAARRWSAAYKEEIRLSRLRGTRFLSDSLVRLRRPPKVFICASAVGFYGNLDPRVCADESTPRGQGFLAELCEAWEKSADVARQAGIRVIHLRTGVVLSPQGGALEKMLPVFRLGLGGRLGNGCQMMSWVALDEVPWIVEHLMRSDQIAGPVNIVSPQSISNAEFTKILGLVLQRSVILPVPSWAIRVMFTEMGETLLLGGARVLPEKLTDSGYTFRYPDLETFLRKILR